MTEGSFETDLEEWRQVAYALQMEDDSEDTRRELTSALLEMNQFLQQKQNENENHFKQQIAAEKEEIGRLKDRISHIEAKDGYKSRDINHDDFVSVWKTLKVEEWQEAFDALNTDERANLDVKSILKKLIEILKISFKKCEEYSNRCLEDLYFSAVYPGEEKSAYSQHKLPKEPDQDLLEACRLCRKKSVAFCIDSIKMTIGEDILRDGKTSRLFDSKSQRVQTALRGFLQKCIEFSWIAKVHESSVDIVTDPKHEGCKEILSQFRHYNDVPNKFTVEWPALVVDNTVSCPWELYNNVAERPKAEPPKEPTTYNTSTVRAEITEENMDWEPEPKVLQYEEERKRTEEVKRTPAQDVDRMKVPGRKPTQQPKLDNPKGKGRKENNQTGNANRNNKGKDKQPGLKNINF